jgi:hypothetical protein
VIERFRLSPRHRTSPFRGTKESSVKRENRLLELDASMETNYGTMGVLMNKPQQLQLERVRIGSFNALDGKRVARDLETNEALWDGFVFGRFHHGELIELRDLPEGHLNADTLYISTTREQLPELLRLAERWAGEVSWHTNEESGFESREAFDRDWGGGFGDDQAVVQVWWD